MNSNFWIFFFKFLLEPYVKTDEVSVDRRTTILFIQKHQLKFRPEVMYEKI